jgi:hypothetical protein
MGWIIVVEREETPQQSCVIFIRRERWEALKVVKIEHSTSNFEYEKIEDNDTRRQNSVG